MRILLLNPNTTASVTDLLAAAARRLAAPGTEIVSLTAPRGVPYIATRAEAQIGGAVALEMLAEHHNGADAAIIGAFGDPGLFGARELFDFPVIGLAEAAILTACMLGGRFTLLTFARSLGPGYNDSVDMHGLGARCAGVHLLDQSFRDVASVRGEKLDRLIECANNAIRIDDADVLILAGAPLAGLADSIKDRLDVPVIDPVAAAVMQAETLVRLRPRKAVAGSFRGPAPKSTAGLPPALAARIEGRDRFE